MFRRPRTTRPSRRRDFDHARMESAVRRVLEPLESRMLLSVSITPNVNWIEQGPAPISGGDIDTFNNAGAVEDIALSPTLPNLAYIATTNGGIWKTTNFMAARPTWTPQTDFMPSLSMGAIALSPLDPQGNTVYAGIANLSSFRRTGGTLLGLMRTTDGGAHWKNFLGNTETTSKFAFQQLSVLGIVPTEIDAAGNPATGVDNQVVLLAVSSGNLDRAHPVSKDNPDNGGIFRSTDGGKTVTRVFEGSATDIIADPADKKRFYAAVSSSTGSAINGIYQSTDGGAHWTLKNAGIAAADLAKVFRIDLEASTAVGNPIYAAIIREQKVKKDLHHDLQAILRLDSPTGQWAKITGVPDVNPGHQADVHFSMTTDPNDSRVIYIAGDRSSGIRGNVHRGDTTGNAWTDINLVDAPEDGNSFPHADSRALKFANDGNGGQFLIDGDDGGVYRLPLNAAPPAPTNWKPINYGLGTVEIASIAWDSINKRLLSGNQDNGSTAQAAGDDGVDNDNDGLIDAADPDERLVWRIRHLGDGFTQAYAVEGLLGANWYSLQNNFDSFYRIALDDTGNFETFVDPDSGETQVRAINITLAAPTKKVEYDADGTQSLSTFKNALSGLTYQDRKKSKDREAFDAPMVVNAIDPARILLGYQGLYESEDRGDHVTIIDNGLTAAGKEKPLVSALAYGGTGNAAVIYAAREDTITVSEAAASKGKKRVVKHYLVRQKNANGEVVAEAAKIQDIVVDPDDWRTVYVIDQSQVFKSSDAGKTWVSLTGQATAAPGTFSSLAVLKLSAVSTDRIVVIGTTEGVFFGRVQGDTLGATHLLGQNLPHAIVKDVQYIPDDDVLIVGTLGRGAWKLDHAQATMTGSGAVLRIDGTSGDDQIVISATDDNYDRHVITVNGVVEGEFNRMMPSVIQIFGGDGNDTVTIIADDGGPDATNGGGSYLPSGKYTVDMGTSAGESNQLVIKGTGDLSHQEGGHLSWLGRLGLLDVVFVQQNMNITNNVISTAANKAATGLTQLSTWSKGIGPVLNGKVGGFGSSVADLLNGVNARNLTPISDSEEGFGGIGTAAAMGPQPFAAAAAADEEEGEGEGDGEEGEEEEGVDKDIIADAGTDFLRRIFEEGLGAFQLGEIGGPNGIETLEQLRDRLIALDDDPTTTTTLTTDANGKPVFDFEVVKDLGGSAAFDVELADGLLALGGLASLDAEVRVHLRFGIDDTGFYIAVEQNTDPEIVISNIHGTIEGDGRVGFIRVEVKDGEFEMDKDVKLSINLHDPGTGAAADGLIRLDELTGVSNDLITVSTKGDSADGLNDDIHFHGELAVDFFEIDLPDLEVDLKWANAEQVDNVTFTVGPALQSLMDIDANQFIDTVLGAAQQLRQATGVDIFAQEIPVLGKSINDMLDGTTTESFVDADIVTISSVFQEDGFNKFHVLLDGIDAGARGIVVGNIVKFTGADAAEHSGAVAAVGDGGFVVQFDLADSTTPKTGADASVKVTHQASLRDQINAALGDLANPVQLSGRVPTLQDLAAALGLDADEVKLSDAGDAIEIGFGFDIDPIHFAQKLDLGGSIGGLQLTAGGDIDVELSPHFEFTAGIRLGAGVPLAERIYLKENDDPEVTLGLKVTLDNPTASGSIGFLNVALAEDTPPDNGGISFLGTLKLNMTDPGTGAGHDGRIILSELTPASLVSSVHPSIAADFVINPLKIVATVGTSTELGKITIRLDAADGHVASLADLTNLPSKIQISGASNFANFQNITPQMIIDALQALFAKLSSMGHGGVLDAKLPVIDKSLSEFIDLGQTLLDKLDQLDINRFATAQGLQDFLEEQLGNFVGVSVKSDGIQFSLRFQQDLHESVPVSLNLGDQFGLLKVEGGGVVDFNGTAQANVTFGLLTGAGIPIAQRLYFDTDGPDASKITISGGANIGYSGNPNDHGFTANVKLGFLDFGISGARALIQLDELLGQLKDPGNAGEGAGRLTFQEITDKIASQQFTAILDGNYSGRVQAIIPLDGVDTGTDVDRPPDANSKDALIEIAGKLENLKNGLEFTDPQLHSDTSVPLTADELGQGVFAGKTKVLAFAHNLEGLIANAVLDFDNLIAGLEKLIEWGDKLLGLGVLDFKLPFTGAKIRDALNFFKDPDGPLQTIKAAIQGSGGLGSKPTDTAAEFAAQKINDALADIPGLAPIVPGGNILDLQHDSNGRLLGATFKFRLSQEFKLLLANPQFDLGLDFFKFNADLDLIAEGFVDVMFGLGIDKSNNGFYLITDFPEAGPNAAEFAIRNVRLSLAGNANVDIGFLELDATFDKLKNYVQANLTVDINGLGDDRLTLSELADFSRLPAAVDGNPSTPELDGLNLSIEAKMDVPLAVASNPDLPSISTNFVLQWGPFGINDIRNHTAAFTTPLVKLEDLTLNAGEFLSKQALPFFQQLNQYNVLAPLIDKLDDPLPIIGGTLFDLLVTNNPLLSQQQKDIATFLFSIGKTIDGFADGIDEADSDDLVINFGDITINGDQSITTSGGGVTASAAGSYPGSNLPFVGGLISDMGDIGITFPMLSVGNLVQLFMGKDVDLIFADLPQLHVGKAFEEDIPLYSVGIPYIGSASLNAVIGGSIDLYVNLAAGLDSSGIKKGASHILEGLYIGDFAPGSDGQIGPGDEERPEVLLEGSVTAGIKGKVTLFGLDLLSVSGKASIIGSVGLDLNDDNDNIQPPLDPRELAARTDGKFYIGEIRQVVDSAGGDVFCMFDIVGEILAKLSFEISVPYAPNPDWSHTWKLVTFDIECEPDPIFPDFGDIVDDGNGGKMLRLTSNPGDSHQIYHSFAATNHADGDPVEIFLIDKDGDADNGLETLRIRKHGFTEDFGPGESGNNFIEDVSTLTLITDQGTGTGKFRLTNFGAGPDSVVIDKAINIPFRLDGGTENDTLTGGNGGGTLLGGGGDDYLSLGEAPTGLSAVERAQRSTFFNGGDGNDQIVGGVGNDTAIGAQGNDTVDGGEGDDIVVGGGGDDVLDGGVGNDRVAGDYDQSVHARPFFGPTEGLDFISGGAGVDLIWGDNRGTSNTADGTQVSAARADLVGDFIFGGDGSDLVFAGAGDDRVEAGTADGTDPNRVFGGTGDDVILGGANRDSLVGQAGNDNIDGGADNDKLYAGDDTFGPNASNMGFDRLTGGEGDDLLDGSDANAVTAFGDAGIDSVIGSRGADDLAGGGERDFVIAGPNNDKVSGGEGNDDIVGGDGTAGGMTVNFTEDDGADSITGDAGDDVIVGDNGSIDATTRAASTTESGGFGIDTASGGAGKDSILGGGAGDNLGGDADDDVIIGDLGNVNQNSISVTPSLTGGADTASGSDGADIIIGGDAGDRLSGGIGGDVIFGDYGSIDRALAANINFTSTFTQDTKGGNDLISGDAGDDTAIGGQAADQISGGDDNDDLIGGHNVAGGSDGGDIIDGDAGNDAIAGDNAAIVRRIDNQSRNTRALAGATLYTAGGAANVTAGFQANLDGIPGRDITLFDHAATTAAGLFGDDNLAGGGGHDSVFGQLGNDVMQGDGATALNVSASVPSASAAASDGNDYLEGGGGGDLMFGNLGQDDLIGGSSELFGLGDGQRPDGADIIFGGSGGDVLRNALGDTTPGGHARDADVILGDNGNIFRIVSSDGSLTYKTFNYDNYAGGVRIIPRAVTLLDYSADGNAANDTGAGDLLRGEAGDDSVHGMSGNDLMTGDGQDDHLLGESGDDWISGGSGDDAMLGDDGRIMTSRNGTAEPLYGIAATSQQFIEVKSLQMSTTINVTAQLKHDVDLEPFAIGGADVMYGGLGNDAMHGGAGQDLMSGAEAQAAFYLPATIPTLAFAGGKFVDFSFATPMAKIAGHPLNFDAFDGTPANIIHDGNDALFGDAGNDWLVGGTDTDRLYGGYGDDVMNADDNLETNGGANTAPDAAPYAGADYAFGGAGRDSLLGNAPDDRLIDWVGEFNNYYVPFNPFGQSTVVRQVSSQLVTFLYALSKSDGADQTRIGAGLGTATRNGEPFGELGLVTQQDPDWLDQNGPPVGPQPQ